jgi:hypothetical protein
MTQAIFFDGSPQKKNMDSDDIEMMGKALSGDLVFTVTPATTTRAAGTYAISRDVTVKLTDADGNVHTWFNKAISNGCSVGDTSTAGTAAIANTTLTFVNGVATKTVTAASAAWVAAETNTLTIAQATIAGYTVAQKTSVETITA